MRKMSENGVDFILPSGCSETQAGDQPVLASVQLASPTVQPSHVTREPGASALQLIS